MVLLFPQVSWDVWYLLWFLWKGENLQYLVRDSPFALHKYVWWLSFDGLKHSLSPLSKCDVL